MTNTTAHALLEAVGVDWKKKLSHVRHPEKFAEGTVSYTYAGPALGSDELDGILLVAGVKKLRESKISTRFSVYDKLGKFWFVGNKPGHALARAIAEVRHA